MADTNIVVASTGFASNEAEYDAADWNYQVVDMGNKDEDGNPYIIALCSDADEARQVAEALSKLPFAYRSGVQVSKT